MTSCANNAPKEEKQEQVEQKEVKEDQDQDQKKGKEYTSAYICPMHCEGSGSAEPGSCPVCGMDYVKNDKDHSDHNH